MYEEVQCKHVSRASSRKGVALSWQAQVCENGRCRLQESSFRHISLCHHVGLCGVGNFHITFTWEDTKLVHGLGWLYLCFHRWTLQDFCGICLRAWYTGYIASNYKSFQGTWPGEKLPHAQCTNHPITDSFQPPPHQSVKNHKVLCTSKVPTNTRQEPNNEICLQYHIYIQFFKSISKGTFFWKKSIGALTLSHNRLLLRMVLSFSFSQNDGLLHCEDSLYRERGGSEKTLKRFNSSVIDEEQRTMKKKHIWWYVFQMSRWLWNVGEDGGVTSHKFSPHQ